MREELDECTGMVDGWETQDVSTFLEELEVLLNKKSMDSLTDTPDYILARYLVDCLDAFNRATVERDRSRGRDKDCPETLADWETPRLQAGVLNEDLYRYCGHDTNNQEDLEYVPSKQGVVSKGPGEYTFYYNYPGKELTEKEEWERSTSAIY